ncbi:Mitochondrial distribution/morphology family 35/apoptosis [Penicillium atrosanguineum]|uniref:Mitochondrial distribution/morphology family 35/apoptosis n=1 Tax=Penicillium atrosanguineum TaxID=1132637 RepID=A0A9W9PU33_9EURO|nr:uncharacterized protein N7443_010555 [Penicillium atrosanguineum]KAJ5132636.1 Mitochondrial distribution/morphology family 35/apoptosis [Penicillium atrosanguineum]KAJ5141479.1 Mitochondrial distribution/morphology family 35/apoptosis [Penicillium atrosanguineum]KAJ5290302.1 hypothetical protein N7443_010555 [Penicillium atrosanguineum]KAJ5308125.1 Mitochondrial distribution/morphology family 35/apoptosis [Penicillium atrosanguineum]
MAASIAPECNEIKEKYDTCFLKWYSEKYLRGNTTSNDCEALFEKYRSCLSKVLKERGIDALLEDARKTNGSETDAEFLKKS